MFTSFHRIKHEFLQSNNIIAYGVYIIGLIVLFINSIITLSYIGWTFEPPEKIDEYDSRQNWFYFLFIFNILLLLLMIYFIFRIKSVSPLNYIQSITFYSKTTYAPIIISLFIIYIFVNILTLSYLNTFTKKTIDPTDTRRKVLVFISWIIMIISMILIIFSRRIYDKLESKRKIKGQQKKILSPKSDERSSEPVKSSSISPDESTI